jgi:hypothetical protein
MLLYHYNSSIAGSWPMCWLYLTFTDQSDLMQKSISIKFLLGWNSIAQKTTSWHFFFTALQTTFGSYSTQWCIVIRIKACRVNTTMTLSRRVFEPMLSHRWFPLETPCFLIKLTFLMNMYYTFVLLLNRHSNIVSTQFPSFCCLQSVSRWSYLVGMKHSKQKPNLSLHHDCWTVRLGMTAFPVFITMPMWAQYTTGCGCLLQEYLH